VRHAPRKSILFEQYFRTGSDPRVFSVQKPLERLAAIIGNDAVPRHASLDVAQRLPKAKFFGTELRTIATDVPCVATAGESLVCAITIAHPAVVALSLRLSFPFLP